MAPAIGQDLIKLTNVSIGVAMVALTLASLWLSVQLNGLLGPLRRRLSLLHRRAH
jgi:hypothetical protein